MEVSLYVGVWILIIHALHEIVEEVLKEATTNSGQWNFDQFIETDAWKPNVDNKCVQRFIKRDEREI